MITYLLENWADLSKFVDLSDVFVRNAITGVIAKRLRQLGFISNKTLSLRVATGFINFSLKG